MTSVAATVFAPLTTSPSHSENGGTEQPADSFGALLGLGMPTALVSLAANAAPTSALRLPATVIASLLATAAVVPEVPSSTAKVAPPLDAPEAALIGSPITLPLAKPSKTPLPNLEGVPDPAPDILVVQPSLASANESKTLRLDKPKIENVPAVPPAENPTAASTSKKASPPIVPTTPGVANSDDLPAIGTCAPDEKVTDAPTDADRPATEAVKADRTLDETPPPARPVPITLLPPIVIALVTQTTVAEKPAPAPDTRVNTRSAAITAPSSPNLKIQGAVDQPIPVAGQRAILVDEAEGKTASGRNDDTSSPSHRALTPGNRSTDPDPSLREASPTFTPTALHSLAAPVEIAAKAPSATIITAQPGRIGQELGVAIAHHVTNGAGASGGGETITLRLNPVDMGRIEVKLSFDDSGTLRAVVSADNPAALDMLRRHSADLGRALSDAGVRADTQTLRFDARGGGGSGGGQNNDNHQPSRRQPDASGEPMTGPESIDDITAAYRPLRTRGGIDMVA